MKKRLLQNSKLYLILDREVQDYPKLFETAKQAIRSGVNIIQLRDKQGTAREILEFSRKILTLTAGKIPYIINDRVDLAKIAQASGVHLGQEDIPLREARRILGSPAIIGFSCQTLEHARTAEREGADYIGFGSVFKTWTKPDRNPMDLKLLERVIREIRIPVFAIGGINLERIFQLQKIGVERFAICRAICRADNVREVVREFRKQVN